MKKRIVSLLLAIITVFSLIQPALAIDDSATGGSGASGGTGSGSFYHGNSGYRIYLVDDSGDIVSTVIDFVFRDPRVQVKNGMYCISTKFDSSLKQISKMQELGVYTPENKYMMLPVNSLENSDDVSKGVKINTWPFPMTLSGEYKGQGDEFREWFMQGAGSIRGNGGGSSGGSYTPGKSTSSGSSSNKPSGGGNTSPSGGGTNSKPSGETSKKPTVTTFDIYKLVSNAMWAELERCNSLGSVTKSQAILSANSVGSSTVSRLRSEYNLTEYQHKICGSAVTDTINSMKGLDWPLRRKALNTGDKSINSVVEEARKKLTTGSLVNSFFDIAYADEEKKSADEEKGQVYALMNYKLKHDGSYLFKFVNSKYTYQDDGNGNKNVVGAIGYYGLKIVVEPIWWFIPAKSAASGKTYVEGTRYDYWFYGTPTDYGRFATSGLFDDGGTGGWNGKAINRTGAHSLLTKDDLVTGKLTVKQIQKSDSGNKAKNSQLANNTLGYAIQYYYADASTGVLPRIPTYDEKKKDVEHPAPDPDPNIPQSEGGIPLTNGELKEPGDPVKFKETVNTGEDLDQYRGYLTDSRNVTIVKVYEEEDTSGKRNHVITTIRENCPSTIDIENEPDYKVIEYFTSPYLLGSEGFKDLNIGIPVKYGDKITEETPWGFIQVTFDTLSVMYAKKNQQFFEWDEVKLKEAGSIQGTVKIAASSVDAADEVVRDDPASDYQDIVLYVRLLKKDSIITHTWDNEKYPDGDPGPAPDPTTDTKYPKTKPDNPYLTYRIVKVYEEEDLDTGEIEHITTTTRYPTVPIIVVQDEKQYKLIEWKYGSPYIPVSSSSEWDSTEISSVESKGSGVQTGILDLTKTNTDTETLYVRLRKQVKSTPAVPALSEDLTESQLTKLSTTNSTTLGWSGYKFDSELDAAVTSHSYTYHVGCVHSCSSKNCTHDCGGHCGDYVTTCSDMTRAKVDQSVYVTFGIMSKDKHETKEATSGAHVDFEGRMYGKSGTLEKEMQYKDDKLSDDSYTWTYVSDGTAENGAEYVTTISRASVGDKLNLASYKKTAMTNDSFTRVGTLFPASNTPTGKRLANGVLNETIGYTLGYIDKDVITISGCVGCGCPEHHTAQTDTKNVTFTSPEKISLSGAFKVFTYGGKNAKTANSAPTNIKEFFVQYADGTSDHSSLFIKQQTATIKFYPYVKMSYLLTADIKNVGGILNQYKIDPSKSSARTVYMLSDKQSTILPTNSIEASWYNKTQADDGYGLQMTSQQWSVHNKATQGSDGWQGVNQVLPGGALYSLATTGTESYVKLITYNTLVEDTSRNWITVSDPTKYTTSSIVQSTQDFLKEAKKTLENFRVVEWVNTDITLENAWKNNSTAVKIAGGGESLAKLNLNTKASTDSKYVLLNGTDTNEKGASEADIDIEKENYQTTVYKGFTDVDGKVYIAGITVNTDLKMLDKATLDSIAGCFKDLSGTSLIKSSIPNLPANMTYAIAQIGTKNQKTSAIIDGLKNSANYNYLYQLDLKTKFITNLIDSVERNTGNDTLNASWTNDGKWYNEAFDGIYVVQQTATYKMGLGVPTKRVSVLDPNLCPAKSSTGNIYTKAHLSQFCLDPKSTIAPNEEDGYLGVYEGTKVYLPDPDTMFYSRPFYIPNANVQDLT